MSESSEESEKAENKMNSLGLEDTINEVLGEEENMVVTDTDAIVKGWVTWCRSHPFVKCVEADVPNGILPKGYTGVLIDVKVGGKKRHGPDDKIYLEHQLLREKVARGNCVLELNKIEKGRIASTKYIFLVFALRKFSGGMGDEDDSDQSQWEKYFLRPITGAKTMISTEKANGEAAHVRSIKLFGETYFCFGSKNVHLLVKNKDDLVLYTEGRFEFARRVARAFYSTYLENPAIKEEQKKSLISFLQSTKYTAVAEIIQPDNQHVVNLSYLSGPELKFICWTKPDLEGNFSGNDSYCALPVNECLDQARKFGLQTIDYEEVELNGNITDIIEEYMEKVRNDNGYEGKVLYFLDCDNVTIGLIKKKTTWYIVLRALREKVARFSSNNVSFSFSEKEEQVRKRFKKLKIWLEFSDNYLKDWMNLSFSFVRWVSTHKTDHRDLRSDFPVLFSKFLEAMPADKEVYQKLLNCADMKNY